MAAKKKKMGAPTKYKPEYCEGIIDFFKRDPVKILIEKYTYKDGTTKEKEIEVPCEIPLLSDYAVSIGITRETLHDWATATDRAKKLKKPDFSYAYKQAKEIQRGILITLSLKGLYNSSYAIFASKNMIGWRDITEIKQDIKTEHDLSPALNSMFDKIYKGEDT